MTHTHFIGIGGTGLSAIARVLIERGEKVSGSDMYSSKNTEMLINLGAEIFISHIAEHVTGADIVVKSSAIPDENPEIVEALFRNIEVLNRKEFLPKMLKNYTTLAISGSHGKTSTTSLLSYLMVEMGIDLSYIVGGEIINLGQNAHAGKSDYFAIEADEYDYMFWGLSPKIAVITNVEHDHPDCFPTSEDFDNAFKGFIDRIVPDGMLIACSDDEGANRMIDYARFKNKTVWTYGFDKNADYRASINSDSESGTHFDFYYKDNLLLSSKLRVLGKHNILNACASLAVLHQLGFLVRDASPILKLFLGAGRRFDIVGEINKTIIVNDYGHHPTEIVSTLEGAKSRYPKRRIWAVWQPHTYSRINGGAVYGNTHETSISENHPLNPICSYGVVKVAIEKYLFMYQQLYGLKPVVLRPSNPFGPRQGHMGTQGLISTFMNKILNKESLEIWGVGNIIRDYIYIDDFSKLCVAVAKSNTVGVFNVGSGVGHSVNDVVEVLRTVFDDDFLVNYKEGRTYDVNNVVLNINQVKEVFNWQPETSLKLGMTKYLKWLKNNEG